MGSLDLWLKEQLKNVPAIRRAALRYQITRARTFLPLVIEEIERRRCKRMLDLGPNTCVTSSLLLSSGYDVVPMDVRDWSIVPGLTPLLYNGKDFPFPDGSFDCGLAFSVLHHTNNAERLLSELRRTCKTVIIQEDLLTGGVRDLWMYFWDSLVNLEFSSHPHANRTDACWRHTLQDLGFEILESKYYSFQFIKFAIYALESPSRSRGAPE